MDRRDFFVRGNGAVAGVAPAGGTGSWQEVRDLLDGFAKIKRVKLAPPRARALSAGINCFLVDGLSQEDTVKRLAAKRIVASVTPDFYSPLYARLAPSLLTLEADVDASIAAVAEIAA